MLRDRYEPMNLFTLVPTLSLALDPVLTQLDRVLDDDTLFQAVKSDLPPNPDRRAAVDAGRGHPASAGSEASLWVEL